MSIVFHCEHCGNRITAKDEAAGKWGTCPACHNKLYIPDLNAEADDLKLAPIDESEEAEKKRLLEETFEITQEILKTKADKKNQESLRSVSSYRATDDDLSNSIISYIKYISEGKLAEAESLENQIIPYGRRAVEIIDRLALSEIPEPELEDISPAVLSGIIKTLRSKIH